MTNFNVQHKRVNYHVQERKAQPNDESISPTENTGQPRVGQEEPYVVPARAGSIPFEEAHPKMPPLETVGSARSNNFDAQAELTKAIKSNGRAGARAISGFFDGSDDTDPSAYHYVHHFASNNAVDKNQCQKAFNAARSDNVTPNLVGKANLTEQAYNVVKSHLNRHLASFGVEPDND